MKAITKARVRRLLKQGEAEADEIEPKLRATFEPEEDGGLRATVAEIAKEMDECPVSHAYAGAQDATVTDWAKRLRRALASGGDHP